MERTQFATHVNSVHDEEVYPLGLSLKRIKIGTTKDEFLLL
jgi:hypothetical protein